MLIVYSFTCQVILSVFKVGCGLFVSQLENEARNLWHTFDNDNLFIPLTVFPSKTAFVSIRNLFLDAGDTVFDGPIVLVIILS